MEITKVFLIQKTPSGSLRCMVIVKGQKQMEFLPFCKVPFRLLAAYYRKYPETPKPSAKDIYQDVSKKQWDWMVENNVGQALDVNIDTPVTMAGLIYRLDANGVMQPEPF